MEIFFFSTFAAIFKRFVSSDQSSSFYIAAIQTSDRVSQQRYQRSTPGCGGKPRRTSDAVRKKDCSSQEALGREAASSR